jgi:hypothetical protein
MKEETRIKISEAQKRKWASGTRKPNPDRYGDKISAKLKIAHSEGRLHAPSYETSMKGLAARDISKVSEAARRVAKMNIGTTMPPGPGAKGPEHHKARYWIIKNTGLGVILEGWNLNDLVRKNHQYFEDGDLNWNGTPRCRATKGLRRLFEIRKSTGRPNALSWKGWRPVDVSDSSLPHNDR